MDDLGHALALADLLAEGAIPGPRPPRAAEGLDEVARLRASVRQLEHALASRVVVEQAIGVLTERWRVAPRDAFEQLRRVTRSRGLRIHDLARQVVASCTDKEVVLPAELRQAGGTPGAPDAPPEPRQRPDRRLDGRRSEEADRSDRRNGRPRRARRDRGQGRSGAAPRFGSEPPADPRGSRGQAFGAQSGSMQAGFPTQRGPERQAGQPTHANKPTDASKVHAGQPTHAGQPAQAHGGRARVQH